MKVLLPSQPGVGQFTPSNFIAVATATAALCCSIVPPFSRTLILLRFAIGQPEALKVTIMKRLSNNCCNKIVGNQKKVTEENTTYLQAVEDENPVGKLIDGIVEISKRRRFSQNIFSAKSVSD